MGNWAKSLSRAGDIAGSALIGFAFLVCLVFSAVGIYLIFQGEITGVLVLVVFGLGSYATGPTLVSKLKRKMEYVHYSTPEQRREWKEAKLDAQQYKKQFESTVEQLILEHAFEKSVGEMLPPWFMRILPFDLPTSEGHAYWTNGEGGYYWGRFLKFWVPLDINTKKSYFRKYDLGESWAEQHTWYAQLFDPDLIEISDDAALDQLAEDVIG